MNRAERDSLPYRMRPEYRRACAIAAKQRAGMTYRVLPIEHVTGMSASAACRRAES